MLTVTTLPFQRRAGLGVYHCTRGHWYAAYAAARINRHRKTEIDVTLSAIEWKAHLIVWFDRNEQADPLNTALPARLALHRLVDAVLLEERCAPTGAHCVAHMKSPRALRGIEEARV